MSHNVVMPANASNFDLQTEYIELGQLLKAMDLVSSGGEAKVYLYENSVLVNGEHEDRRGRKLRTGDLVELPDGRVVTLTSLA